MVNQPSITSMEALASRPLTNNDLEYHLIRGSSLYAVINGSVEINGSVAILKSNIKNCDGAAENAVGISTGMILNMASNKISKNVGTYKVCYASKNENNTVAALDTLYVMQPLRLFVIDPEIAVTTSRMTDSTMMMTVSGIPNPARLAFMPAETLGCTGANAYAGTPYSHNFEDNFRALWNEAIIGQKKMCYALDSTDGTSDYHYADQGYLYGYNDPQVSVDDSFTSGTASYPLGIARNEVNGNIFVSSMIDNKIFKITSNGVQTEYYSGLSGPFGLEVDSASGDIYVCEVNASKFHEFPKVAQRKCGSLG